MRFREVIRSLDYVLVGVTVLLVLIGLAMLFSATYTQQGLLNTRFARQVAAVGVSLVVALLVVRIPYHVMRRWAWPIYVLGLLGLGAVAGLAQVIRGTVSRLSVVGFQLQPSEFIKISLIIALAWLLARQGRVRWQTFWQTAMVAGIPIGLILLEPDLGVAMLLLGMWGGVLVFMGLSWRILGVLFTLGLVVLAGGWRWFFAGYQKARILVFLDPTSDPLGAGYNVVQSIVALGSGRFLGRGLGHGPQSQLKFLPEQHTDFILASIGEELGFIGVAAVIILYAILLWRILVIAKTTQDLFGQLLCVGTFLMLLISFVVAVGMNMGLLPVTGIPLPLVSYGGSNLLCTFVLLAIVQSVRVYSKWVQAPPGEMSHFG